MEKEGSKQVKYTLNGNNKIKVRKGGK